jgi:hypothetical protein
MSAATADVFLSYSRTDAPAVRQIQVYLKQAGFATFLDRDQLPAGQPWLPALEQAIARCTAVVVLVGPAGLGAWQQREVQLALDRQTEAERGGRAFPVIPVLLPKVEDPPGGFLRLQTWVDLRSDIADPTQLNVLLTGLAAKRPPKPARCARRCAPIAACCRFVRKILAFSSAARRPSTPSSASCVTTTSSPWSAAPAAGNLRSSLLA